MATAHSPLIKSKVESWLSSNSTIYPAASSVPMTDIMSFQYPPPPPQNGTDMDIQHSGYMPYPVPPSGSSGMDLRHSPETGRDRSDSYPFATKPNRSMSTSQTSQPPLTPRDPTTPDQGLSGDKRRNKLGYHRTSVACGHCRRRKIRCIPSQNDVQARCVNCIRLKKECSFYPVDQQPPQDTRQKSVQRSSTGPKVTSTSSSPAMQSGIPSEVHGHSNYPHLSLASITNMPPPMKPSGTEDYAPDSKIPPSATSTRSYEYGQHGMANWMSPDAGPNTSKPSDMNPNWRSYPSESSITPAFSPYTPHGPQSATWSAAPMGSEPSRDDLAWSSSGYPAPPSRSMSFGGGGDGMASQQDPATSQMGGGVGRLYDRKSSAMSSDIYPSPIATTIPGIDTVSGTSHDHHSAISAGAVPPAGYASWQQPYQQYSKPAEGYSAWYGEGGNQQGHGM
ncbi:hypothetical protein SMACR_00394 [Sordaria macrospora]|nr:hypothetical protein SMACR_00394 [Sordaria macrospora]WPJ59138.1 hypothetical protein SMAC4_00394 [Sordaria macrospora]